jgi:hypothetical protein
LAVATIVSANAGADSANIVVAASNSFFIEVVS